MAEIFCSRNISRQLSHLNTTNQSIRNDDDALSLCSDKIRNLSGLASQNYMFAVVRGNHSIVLGDNNHKCEIPYPYLEQSVSNGGMNFNNVPNLMQDICRFSGPGKLNVYRFIRSYLEDIIIKGRNIDDVVYEMKAETEFIGVQSVDWEAIIDLFENKYHRTIKNLNPRKYEDWIIVLV